jgi:transposase-like protein
MEPKAPKQDMNIIKLINQFHSEEKSRAFLEEIRWPDGVTCPRCKAKSISTIGTRHQFECNKCGYQFSATSGTIFHDSHLPLWKWLLATYMMIEAKKGVSANQVKRMLSVSYKTSWYLCHRIRAAMAEADPEKLGGTVEVDEAFIGGKPRYKQKKNWRDDDSKRKKAMVLGIIERGGNVRLKYEGDEAYKEVLRRFVRRHSRSDTKRIITDEWPGYRGIGDHDTLHDVIKHRDKQYVVGDVHTNTIEGVWSLLNRSIIGAYHKVSVKHLDAYLDELEWRFNNRKNPYLFRETVRKLISATALPYKNLTVRAQV